MCVYDGDENLYWDDAGNCHSETTFGRHCSYNEEESIIFSISAINFRITGLLNGLRIVFFATWQGVLQRHTSQNNRHYLQTGQIQTFSGMPGC